MAGTASASRERRPVGLIGWCARILGGVAVLMVIAAGALFAAYRFAYLPQHQAEQRRAAAFARLSGPARRLAIYDAFVAQIDQHYYDQSFSGFDWPKMRREWRAKAAAEPDDSRLYVDVFLQMTQRFPSSHVATVPPSASSASTNGAAAKAEAAAPTPACGLRDAGMQLVALRRGRGVALVVGDVWPDTPAAGAGVTPGWFLESGQDTREAGGRRFDGVFLRLDPAQMHTLESTGAVQLVDVASPGGAGQAKAALERIRQRVEFEYRCGRPIEPFATRRLASGAVYIRLDQFQAPVLKLVEAALKTADDRGVILDLRSNVGGHSILGLNLLLPRLKPVYVERGARGRRLVFTDLWTWRYGGPLAVLVGPASASAAEITAAALQREHRAVIVGRRTNGSVLGSNAFPLPDGGAVQVPVAAVEMLDGRRLEGAGVAPDIEVFPTAADLGAGRDAALERAERELLKRSTAPKRG